MLWDILLVKILLFGPWLVVGALVVLLPRTTLGKALLQRLRRGGVDAEEFSRMAGELELLHQEMAEVQERLDFVESLAAQHRDALPAPRRSRTPTPPQTSRTPV